MSVSVNLILPNEKRSGSKINPKSVMRVASLVIPLLILLLLFLQGVRYFILQTNLNMQESRWESAAPRQNQAKRQLARLNLNMRIANEIGAWRNTSPAWDATLLALMQNTPQNIQITTLRMQASAAPGQAVGGSPPKRRPSLLIEGRVSEPDAMRAIENFQQTLGADPLIKPYLERSEVVNFAADPAALGTEKRVFSIRIQFLDLSGGNS